MMEQGTKTRNQAEQNGHWVTLHRLRFDAVISATDRSFPAPDHPESWRFYPCQALTADGLPSFASDVWCGFAIHDSRAQAEAMFADPAAHLPQLAEAVEHWHALAAPFAHHGSVNWRGTVQTDSALRLVGDLGSGGGPVLVITSAGFDADTEISAERRKAFLAGVEDVLAFYGQQSGNLRRAVFNGSGVDGREGFTVSLWRNDPEMMAGAYKTGAHRTNLDAHRADPMFDRSSFSRLRVLDSRGTWDGDPFAA
jgi:hypothetical protein